ncbi:3'-5' exonuclease [Tropicimonas isoalkanivorans]|uniref:3'-5' exonuclease n=1 Tax=Tropicimonas isoalkanivorans TaxID=441112 RepID=UPI000B88CC38
MLDSRDESPTRFAQQSPSQGYAEIAMRRSVIRPKPLPKTLSTVHKSKGLECSNTMIMHCDRASFGNTIYGRCKFYVGISRAKSSLVIVIPKANPSLIFKIP